jgi:hypothetical protein
MNASFEHVRQLNLPAGKFAVFGSGPLVARGIRGSEEADIIVTEDLFKQLAKDESWDKVELRDHHQSLRKGDLEIFYTWAPGAWDVAELIRTAEGIDGLPFVRLEAVIEWKQLRNEVKDQEDLKLIEEYRTAHQ